jgi:[protein-PII] uridylyltransferase
MTVITQDKKRLFERITSGCLDMNINIVDARIFSNKSNVIDILWIQDNFGKKIVDRKRLSRIKEKILLFINEDEIPLINYEDNIDKRSSAFNILPDVSIYNSLSKKYSVIEVSAKDRPGLLNDLTRKISDLSIDIRSAHIATFGERATDVFYVLNKSGEKISSKNKIENIQKELIKSISFSEYV